MTKEEEKYTTLDTEQCKWWVNNLFGMAKEQACNSHNFDDAEEMQSAEDKIIKSLEIVEEFERARIITGGRLNGRTYAYKCGLEDGKRKALEQQTINCNATTEEIAQSFKADVEAVKDYFPKCNSMEFPKTFDEFANDYGFTDDKEIYTNGSHLIPVFRVKQWLDHIEQQHSDCVSRKAMLNAITEIDNNVNMDIYTNEVREIINALPPVTPTRKVGKWEYKQLGFRKYGLVCTSCGYAIHLGYEFTSMEEFKDMVERKLQNPHITMDMFCCKCGAEMVGTEND